ncbi:MAG: hypothetical protein DRI34_10025 [Deltaproteobacteria bacterium]|nr:MAG: hypothetical protein DRI34_10025 [Deltaproteobacteria bacterium]
MRTAGATPRIQGRQWPAGLVALGCLAVQIPGGVPATALALLVWLVTLLLADRTALRALWLPRFWLVSLLLASLSGLLLGQHDVRLGGLALSRTGLEAGLLMVLRGGFMFALASWASRRLREPGAQRLAECLGARSLGQAFAAAVDLLPELQRLFTADLASAGEKNARGRVRRLARAFSALFYHTASLAEQMSRPVDNVSRRSPLVRPRLVAVVGSPGSGKTTSLLALASSLRRRGITVGGVVQPAQYRQGRKTGYRLRDIASGEEIDFARRSSAAGEQGLPFRFDPAGWEWSRDRLRRQSRRARVLLVDELGLLEAGGGGHLQALLSLGAANRADVWLLAVRADCAEVLGRMLGGFDAMLQPGCDPEHVLRQIILADGGQAGNCAGRAKA